MEQNLLTAKEPRQASKSKPKDLKSITRIEITPKHTNKISGPAGQDPKTDFPESVPKAQTMDALENPEF